MDKVRVISLLSLSLLSSLSTQAKVKSKGYTNFIIINLDDAGYGDFGYNGARGYTTPNIDALARDGVQFTNFYASQPVSGASRAGLLTGCYPNRFGFFGAPFPGSKTGIPADEVTIAELLKQKGYTSAIFGKWHLGAAPQFLPLNNGFDQWCGIPYSNDMWPLHPENNIHSFSELPLMEGSKVAEYITNDQSNLTTLFTERSVDFIRQNRKTPFFLYLAHPQPHVPLYVSDKFKGKSGIGLFGDVIMEIDWSVGRIIETLRELGIEDNTVVIFTSDNGPWLNYGNHAGSAGGLREGKGTTFEGGNRVPCLVYWKGHTISGSSCNKLATNMDFFPTIAQIAGADLPSHKIDGVSLLPLFEGNYEIDVRDKFAYYYNVNDLEAVTDGRFKLVFPHKHRSYEGHQPGRDGMPGATHTGVVDSLMLFDLVRDPGERYNVIDSYPEVVEELKTYAATVREDIGDNLTGVKGKNNRPIGRVSD